MKKTCAVCNKGIGPTQCEICGFSDNDVINREFNNIEDANHWLKTVVIPYHVKWEENFAKEEHKAIQINNQSLKNKTSNKSIQSEYTPPYRALNDVYRRAQQIVQKSKATMFNESASIENACKALEKQGKILFRKYNVGNESDLIEKDG